MKAMLGTGVGVLAVVLAIVLLRAPGPAASAKPAENRAPPLSAPPARAADPDLPWPARDPFRYAEEHRQGATSAPAPINAAPSPAPAPTASANPLRLIGVVRKGGTVKAAVSLWGETAVMAVGEESRGYKVLSIDDEGAVRLRGPDGSELTLPPSPF